MLHALMSRPSVRDVLARVGAGASGSDATSNAGDGATALTPAAEEAARAALARIAAAQMPWYLRALIAFGAWIGASFLLSTITSLILMASGELMSQMAIAIGIAFLLASIVFRRRVNGSFGAQLALVVSFTGQILLVGGTGEATNSIGAARIAAILSSAALIAFFPDRIQRFSATLVIVGTIATVITQYKLAGAPDGLAAALVTVILVLWRFAPRDRIETYSHIVEPVIYGLIASLLITLVTHTIVSMFDVSEAHFLRIGNISVITFTVAQLVLTVAILHEHDIPLHAPIAMVTFASIVLLGVLTRTTPAIAASIMLLVLAFDRRSRVLMALATVFLLAFLAAFYYDMRLTLLEKSGMLMLTGAVCLAACAALRIRIRTQTQTQTGGT